MAQTNVQAFSGDVQVAGVITGGTFSGSGALLTSLNASNVSTGSLTLARGGTGTTNGSVSNVNVVTVTNDVNARPIFFSNESSATAVRQLRTKADLTFTPTSNTLTTTDIVLSGKIAFGTTVRQMIDLFSTSYGIGVQSSTTYFRSASNYSWFTGGSHSTTENNAGTNGTVRMRLKDGNLSLSNTTASTSTTTGVLVVSGGVGVGGNVHVGGTLAVASNLAVDTNTLFVDSVANRVGIGTTSPRAPLTVAVNGAADNTNYQGLCIDHTTQAATARSGLSWFNTDQTFEMGAIRMEVGSSYNSCRMSFFTSTNRNTATEKMTITHNGRVGIGKTNPGVALDVVGDITASGNITAFSDRRLKTNIDRIERALDKIEQLNGYTYTMNGIRYTGLIAQEVKEVLPEAVVGSEETKYALAYGNMMGLIVEAIKELKEKIG